MPESDTMRVSGRTGGREAAEIEADDMEQTATATTPEERTWASALNHSRIRLDWRDPQVKALRMYRQQIEVTLIEQSPLYSAYVILYEIWAIVREREPATNARGAEIELDVVDQVYNPPELRWVLSPTTNLPLEDWSRLTDRDRNRFYDRIVTEMMAWREFASELRYDALFAKAFFTERFAHEYRVSFDGTVEHRTASANERAAEEKYFALYKAQASHRADEMIKTMEGIANRFRLALTS